MIVRDMSCHGYFIGIIKYQPADFEDQRGVVLSKAVESCSETIKHTKHMSPPQAFPNQVQLEAMPASLTIGAASRQAARRSTLSGTAIVSAGSEGVGVPV